MADKVQVTSNGGQFYNICANATCSVVSSSPGRLCKLIFLLNFANSTSTSIYDNATGAGGTIIYNTLPNTAVGTVVDLQIPVANGIYWGGAVNTPQALISFTKDGAYGLANS